MADDNWDVNTLWEKGDRVLMDELHQTANRCNGVPKEPPAILRSLRTTPSHTWSSRQPGSREVFRKVTTP